MPHARSKRLMYVALVVASGTALAAIYYYWPGLRFEYDPANYVVYAIVHLSLPVTIFPLAFSCVNRLARAAIVAIAIVVTLPTAVLAISALAHAYELVHTGHDQALQLVGHLEHSGVHYRLYLTKADPYKAHSLLLRREKPLFLGLKRVEQLREFYGTQDGVLVVLSNERGQVTTKPYTPHFKTELFEFSL